MADIKYDTNIINKKNIISSIISIVITYILCNAKGKKKHKKPFKTFSKSFSLISELWTSIALKNKADKVKEDTFPVKIEKAKIINL